MDIQLKTLCQNPKVFYVSFYNTFIVFLLYFHLAVLANYFDCDVFYSLFEVTILYALFYTVYTSILVKSLTCVMIGVTELTAIGGALHVAWQCVPPFILETHHWFCAGRALGTSWE